MFQKTKSIEFNIQKYNIIFKKFSMCCLQRVITSSLAPCFRISLLLPCKREQRNANLRDEVCLTHMLSVVYARCHVHWRVCVCVVACMDKDDRYVVFLDQPTTQNPPRIIRQQHRTIDDLCTTAHKFSVFFCSYHVFNTYAINWR